MIRSRHSSQNICVRPLYPKDVSNSLTTQASYDILGNVKSRTEARTDATLVTTFGYTACGNIPSGAYAFVTSATNPANWSASACYDYYSGRVESQTDVRGLVTHFDYASNDLLDRVSMITVGYGLGEARREFNYSYIDTPLAVSIETTSDRVSGGDASTDGYYSKTDFDGLGRTILLTNGPGSLAAHVATEYDGLGRVKRVSNPFGTEAAVYTVNGYDALNRVKTVQRPDGSTAQTTYNGQTSQVLDEASKRRDMTMDALGRVVSVVEDPASLNYLTSYTYNAAGNLTDVWQGTQHREFVYDKAGRLTSATNPESSQIGYTYDGNGNLLAATDARSQVVTRTYDTLNRPVTVSHSAGGFSAVLCYDGKTASQSGCSGTEAATRRAVLTETWSPDSTSTYTTDSSGFGRVTASSQTTNGSSPLAFSYAYNVDGSMKTEGYPSGRVVAFHYNRLGQPDKVGLNSSTNKDDCVTSATYKPHGGLNVLSLKNGLTETWDYNSRLQPISINATKSTSQWNLENFYCASWATGCTTNNGNVRSQRLTVPKTLSGNLVLDTVYGYDNVNRLISAAESGGAQGSSYTHSYTDEFGANGQFGNVRTSGTGATPSGLMCATYASATNRCAEVDKGYDLAGNLTSYSGRTIAYDSASRQTQLVDSGVTSTYTYDAEGRRVKKTTGVTAAYYVYDAAGQLAAEYGSNSGQPDCTTCFLTEDHLGSTRMITAANGDVKARYDYHPFGWEINSSYNSRDLVTGYLADHDNANPKFTGQRRDYESGLGLDYFEARYFSSAQGRFNSPDPVLINDLRMADPQQWNLYSYVRNNPLKLLDPDGREVQVLDDLALERIRSTVPENLRASITAKNGVIVSELLNKIETTDANFLALREAANDPHTMEVATAGSVPEVALDGKPVPFEYKSVAAIVKDLASKGYRMDPKELSPTLYLGYTSGIEDNASGHVRVTLSDGSGPAATTPVAEQAITAAHEIYGHGLPDMQGKPWTHDNGGPVDANIKRIEDRTKVLYDKKKR